MLSQDLFRKKDNRDVMYRSNSSLDLIYAEHPAGNGLRREYGSHGSIDVIGGDRVPGMVHARSERSDFSATDHADGPTPRSGSSPKPRLKFHKLWGGNGGGLAKVQLDDATLNETLSRLSMDSDSNKKRQFAHYDCQSLLANLSYAATLRGALLSRRRNTTTGASAASLLAARGSAPGDLGAPDTGDGRSNQLVESCPFFRNELGGEEERCVSLCRRTSRGRTPKEGGWHKPRAAYGLSILEYQPGHSHWKNACPFAPSHLTPLPIESQDLGALYYRKYFYNQPHQNWFGMDDNLGPVAISIKKERVELRRGCSDASVPATTLVWQYRLVLRTSELLTLRGAVLEECIPTSKQINSATYNTKDVFEYVAPELQLNCLRLGVLNNGAEDQLLRLDEQCLTRHYKVGVMYCKAGQSTEEEMYNNQEAGPAFVEFLQMLGQTVRLKGFDKYKAGLDNKSDSTGLYSVYTTYQNCELMFHVSTMLPYTQNNRQQLLRKRHIGNDIVTIVFQEPGAAAFTPRNIRSQFQHVFVVVRVIDPCTENTHYSIAVTRAKEVPIFGPPIKEGAVYPKGEVFTDLLLSKVINGENAAIQSPKFSTMATRTRQEYLKDLAKNYITQTSLDTGQKFSLFASLLQKGGSNSSAGGPLTSRETPLDVSVGGALCFQVQVEDEGSGGTLLDCVAGVSADTIVLVESSTRQIVLVLPTEQLLGWVVWGVWTRVYYHVGECVRLRGATSALLARLQAVAPMHATALQETALDRGSNGQLGFHVQPDGLVTAVEGSGGAGRAGLRPGARLVEVCRAAVTALHHDHLVDLLKTSDPVTVTISLASGCRGSCSAMEEVVRPRRGDAQLPGRQRRAYEPRALSPPRSDSEGYGTGGSGRSGRRSPGVGGVESPRRDHNSPRHKHKRHSVNTSLTEEIIRYMDTELGSQTATPHQSPPKSVAKQSVNNSTSNTPTSIRAAPSPRALPLPDASALDWSTLVHTATRVLQIYDENQYPSMENSEPSIDVLGETQESSWQDNTSPPPVPPAPAPSSLSVTSQSCNCGLSARVAALENDAKLQHLHRQKLEEEVRRLRRNNAHLREESARAVDQLRRFTQWFMHTVDRQHN